MGLFDREIDEEFKRDIEHRFAHHPPARPETVEAHEGIRDIFKTAAMTLHPLPECREKALALTKLEEAMMWANAAIARNPYGVGHHEPDCDSLKPLKRGCQYLCSCKK